jgi:hypothetical protein
LNILFNKGHIANEDFSVYNGSTVQCLVALVIQLEILVAVFSIQGNLRSMALGVPGKKSIPIDFERLNWDIALGGAMNHMAGVVSEPVLSFC